MSYCRFSSDNFKSDLYVYENVAGCWTVHVAASRHIGDSDCPSITLPDDPDDKDQLDAAMNSYKAQREWLKSAKLVPIDLPHAGETFHEPTPGACADRIEKLVALGYHVPTGVVEALREEEAQP